MRVDGACWSIAIEMVFYVLLPILALGLARTRSLRAGRLFVLVVMVVLAVVQFAIVRGWPPLPRPDEVPRGDFFSLAVEWLPTRNPFGLFLHFLIGTFAASFVLDRRVAVPTTGPPTGPTRRWNRSDWVALGTFVALGVDLGLRRFSPRLGDVAFVLNGAWYHRHLEWVSCGWPTFPIGIGVLLVALARSRRVGAALDVEPFRTTARLSYGIYLWHMPVLYGLDRLRASRGVDASAGVLAVLVVAGLAGSYLIAWLSYRFLEAPVMSWSRRFEKRY